MSRAVDDLPEKHESLWRLTLSPAIWMVHFLLSYVTASVWCAKLAGRDGSLWQVRIAVGAFTVAALIGIGIVGWRGFRRHTFGGATLPHDYDSAEDRHRFLGFATVLLSALSAVAVLYAALAAFFIETCH
jgi:hypothetical protein